MTTVVTVFGLVAAVYVTFTLSATGWAKLSAVRSSSARLRAEALFLPPMVARVVLVVTAMVEIAIVTAAAIRPGSEWPPIAAVCLFGAFVVHNGRQVLAGRNDEPCTCAGETSARAARESTASARVVANLVAGGLASLWAATSGDLPRLASLVFALALLVPLIVWVWRRGRPSGQEPAWRPHDGPYPPVDPNILGARTGGL